MVAADSRGINRGLRPVGTALSMIGGAQMGAPAAVSAVRLCAGDYLLVLARIISMSRAMAGAASTV
jgi:hypothetical protein